MSTRLKILPFTLTAATCALALAGCLSRPALVRQDFALQTPPTAKAGRGEGVLLLRWCEASPPFDGRAFVYRTGPNAYEMDPYAGFIVPAGRAVAGPVRAYLRDSGAFADVVEPGSRLNADVWLEIHIVELYGDFREHEQPAAVLKLRMIFFDATNSNSGKAFLQKSYSRRLSIRENTAAAVVAGWNQALGEILGEAVSDLAVARRNS